MKRLLLASVGMAAMVGATPATAQGGVDAGEASAPQAGGESTGIAEIIVTASRRSESAQRSALSIQALSSEDLSRANVTRPEDLSAVAPGVSIASGGNYPQVYIRGVGNFAANSQAEGAVAFNLDGVYISRAASIRGSFFDLERVEVLKGPQGTLYGRNASGGAINIITNKPKLGQRGGFVDLQAGNYSMVQGSAAVNLPVGDTVALRASGQIVHRNGYLSDGFDDEKSQSARLQLYWEPNSDVSLLLSAGYQHVYGKGAGPAVKPQLPGNKWRGATDPAVANIIANEPFTGPFLVAPQDNGFVDYMTYTAGAELNWNLGFATLTVLPAYRNVKLSDLNYVAGFGVAKDDESEQASLEARLGNASPDFKWVLGGYFFDEHINNPDGTPAQVALQGVGTFVVPQQELKTRSYAAFGQATYSVTDRFRITGGLRYTHERKSLENFLINYGLPNAFTHLCDAGTFDPASPYPPQFCRIDVDNTGANKSMQTYNSVSWKAGVEFDLADRSMAYANASTGFKSGGFFSAPPPNSFRPEKLTAFAAGVKNRFLDNRLQVNVEAFYWRYKDHQETSVGPTSIPGFFALLTYNAGQATSYGADLDVVFEPTSRDQLGFKVQYNKTKYDTFTYDAQAFASAGFAPPVTGCAVGALQMPQGIYPVDCSGKQMMRAPLWSGNASYGHDFELANGGKINARADVEFSSSYWLSTEFLPTARQDAFAMGNANLTYTDGDERLSVSVFVRNIWNQAVYSQSIRYAFVSPANPLANPEGLMIGTLRPPRTYGVRVGLNF